MFCDGNVQCSEALLCKQHSYSHHLVHISRGCWVSQLLSNPHSQLDSYRTGDGNSRVLAGRVLLPSNVGLGLCKGLFCNVNQQSPRPTFEGSRTRPASTLLFPRRRSKMADGRFLRRALLGSNLFAHAYPLRSRCGTVFDGLESLVAIRRRSREEFANNRWGFCFALHA